MRISKRLARCILVLLVAACPALGALGETRVAKWKDEKKAVFLVMFDDSWPSHFEVAVPALTKRGMTATFYINPGKGEYKVFKKQWEENVWKAGMAYGNHTMTHQGITSPEKCEYEVGACTAEILRIVPGKNPRLISWATPGVGEGKWTITKQELAALWKKHNLIDRPPFKDHGAVYHFKTTPQMLALADRAISKGEMEYLVIHGVERRAPMNTSYQDFWALNQDVFNEVLDGLQQRRDAGDLWITDHISYHKYMTERQGATVRVIEGGAQQIRVELTSTADAELYDEPLTLVSDVPEAWKQAEVTQAGTSTKYAVSDGMLRFEAQPNAGVITITPAELR